MIPRFTALFAFVVLASGCGRGGGKVEDFTPTADKGRKALEAALGHWKEGGKPGAVPNTAPKVEATDAKWSAGLKITAFEILGEEPGDGSAAKIFKVKLTPSTGSPVETTYAVLGIEPILVYRDEDYRRLSGAGK